MTTFTTQFNQLIQNKTFQNKLSELLNLIGKNVDLQYFGVNYTDTEIVSLKLYFSFLQLPKPEILSTFDISNTDKEFILKNWEESKTYDFLHQGLTLGLKCHKDKNGAMIINNYFHFRSKTNSQQPSKFLTVTHFEPENFPGYCIEKHDDGDEQKDYFYYKQADNIKTILNDFDVSTHDTKVSLVEYTESSRERKINMIFPTIDDSFNYLKTFGKKEILALSTYFFANHNLYVYGHGVRLNSPVKAIYFVSNKTLNKQKDNTLSNFLNK